MDTVRVRYNGGRRFVGWDEAGHGVVMDSTKEYKGDGSGVRPIEAVLYALGGCTGIDVIGILAKQHQDVTDFELVVTGTQREEHPHFYETVHVEYIVTGHGVNPDFVARAIELSEDKYCSVRGMFGDQVKLTSSFRVLEHGAEG